MGLIRCTDAHFSNEFKSYKLADTINYLTLRVKIFVWFWFFGLILSHRLLMIQDTIIRIEVGASCIGLIPRVRKCLFEPKTIEPELITIDVFLLGS